MRLSRYLKMMNVIAERAGDGGGRGETISVAAADTQQRAVRIQKPFYVRDTG